MEVWFSIKWRFLFFFLFFCCVSTIENPGHSCSAPPHKENSSALHAVTICGISAANLLVMQLKPKHFLISWTKTLHQTWSDLLFKGIIKTEGFDRMSQTHEMMVEAGIREIQSFTVRQIVPLATRCPFNFSACWLTAKELCLSQREPNLACLPGYSSAKAPCNKPLLSAFSGRLLWCSCLPGFSRLTVQTCTNPPTLPPLRLKIRAACWLVVMEKKWDGAILTNGNQLGIVSHFGVMQLDVHFQFPSPSWFELCFSGSTRLIKSLYLADRRIHRAAYFTPKDEIREQQQKSIGCGLDIH